MKTKKKYIMELNISQVSIKNMLKTGCNMKDINFLKKIIKKISNLILIVPIYLFFLFFFKKFINCTKMIKITESGVFLHWFTTR